MKTMHASALLLAVLLASSLPACSVAPRNKTVVLPRPKPSPTATLTPTGSIAFDLEKATVIQAGNFDTAGYFSPGTQLVYGWLDNDHLAAIGVMPVPSPSATTESADLDQKKAKEAPVPAEVPSTGSTKGLIGQILSVDWQTGKTTEAHTVQDEVILSVGLSHDKTKLWYTSIGASGTGKLMVTDISFKHVLLEVTDYMTVSPPVWSSGDKYLGYFTYEKKVYAQLNLFDGTESGAYVISDMKPTIRQSIVGIQDDTGELLLQQYDGLILSLNMNKNIKKASSGASPYRGILAPTMKVAGTDGKTALSGANLLLTLSMQKEGMQLWVQDISSGKLIEAYDGVLNFALSDDQKYICLVRRTVGNSADVSIAEWRGGKLSNEKTVFKGFVADGNIFFSPDDSKLYMEGNYGYTSKNKSAMILKFK